MAVTYSLESALALDAPAALQQLAPVLGLSLTDAAHLHGASFHISALGPSDLGTSVIEDAFHFRPTLSLGFRIDSNASDEDYVAAKHVLIRAVMTLLGQQPGDAVLLFNGEIVLLQRLNEQLTLNQDWREWTSYDLLRDVTLPYDLRPLPSPLL